jgi:hypothetical protein
MKTMPMPSPCQLRRTAFPSDPADFGTLLYASCLHRDGQWEMNHGERNVLRALLERIRPRLSIEVGTFRGGSLSLISQYSESAFSLDIDPTIPERLKGMKNTQFIIGPSAQTLPLLLQGLAEAKMDPEFILIDADHTEQGVRSDLQAVLARPPRLRTFVLMHDSFNPGCRRGMLTAGWENHPFVHAVEIDFIAGSVVDQPGSPADGQLWGGLALAVLDPKPRTTPLVISASARKIFQRCMAGG